MFHVEQLKVKFKMMINLLYEVLVQKMKEIHLTGLLSKDFKVNDLKH